MQCLDHLRHTSSQAMALRQDKCQLRGDRCHQDNHCRNQFAKIEWAMVSQFEWTNDLRMAYLISDLMRSDLLMHLLVQR